MPITDINLNNLHTNIDNTISYFIIHYSTLMQQKLLVETEIKENLNEFLNSLKNSNDTIFNKQILKVDRLINEIECTDVETEKPSQKVMSLKSKKVFAHNLKIFKNQLTSLNSISKETLEFLLDDFIIYNETIQRFSKMKLLQKKDKTPLTLKEVYNLENKIIEEIQKTVSEMANKYIQKDILV